MSFLAKISFLFALVSSGMLVYFLVYSQIGEEEMARRIEGKITERISEMEDWVKNKRTAPSGQTFDVFSYQANGKLSSWSTNGYVPDYTEISNSQGVLLKNGQGDFLVVKGVFKDSLVVAVTTIHRSYSIANSYLKDSYNTDLVPGNVEISSYTNSIPVKYNDETIFLIRCTGMTFYDEKTNSLITGLLAFLGISVLVLIVEWSIVLRRKWGEKLGIISILILLSVFKLSASLINLPTSFSRMPVFEPDTFSFRWFYPTLGDGMINVVLIVIFLYFLVGNRQKKGAKNLSRNIFESFILLIASYVSLYLFGDTIQIILRNSSIGLDIASSLTFSFERIVAYFLILLLGLKFFILHFLLYRQTNGNPLSKKISIYLHLTAILLALPFLLISDILFVTIPLNALYLLGLHHYRLPDSLTALKFGSVNYLLFTCVLLSGTGSFMIYKGLEKNDRYEMQKYVSYLHVARDVESEFELSRIRSQIEKDTLLLDKNTIRQKEYYALTERIKRQYFRNYFRNYEIDINYFDERGVGLTGRYEGLHIDLINLRSESRFQSTAYPLIFYDPSRGENKRKRYICTVSLQDPKGAVFGFLEIELLRKKVSSKRVLPQLLVSGSLESQASMDYAIFLGEELSYANGSFDYNASFDPSWVDEEALYTKGLEVNGWSHLASRSDSKMVVVSRETYSLRDMATNFSFLFMLLLLSAVLVFAVQLLTHRHFKTELYFSTKIMLYSVGSFAFPLILVAVAILTTTDRSNRLEIDKSNLKKTLLVSENIDTPIEQIREGRITQEKFDAELTALSAYSGMDINVFDTKGMLLYSSTPEIFENRILSRRLRPEVVNSVILNKGESHVIEERIGDFKYKSSFAAINSPNTGKLLGVLQSPYFASKNHVKRQQLQVFGDIINIFTFIFIISIGMAYRIISRLTQPIMNIADKLHQTGFVGENQPIEWKADDEIGVLVNEYNSMVSKLEETKKELAQNEKEAAWREMAKQVAHEIKNPLTPMKLSIQHLSRILGGRKEDKKSLEILLSQIDTLDEIVTSFSHFAKMPTPSNEPFDIADVLNRSIDLHVDKKIVKNIKTEKAVINGDIKLFGRIFNNLILNAFESMRHLEQPMLEVSLQQEGRQVRISFKDMGSGIPDENREKVFVPNFSTKDSGTGIGLAVAKRGIEHAGGTIWFESQPTKGTTFFIELPQFSD